MVGRRIQEYQDKFDEHDKHQLRLVEDRNNARLHAVFKKIDVLKNTGQPAEVRR